MKRSRSTIGVNLFLGIFGSMAVVFLSFSYFSAKQTAHAWEHSFEEHANQTNAIVERVLRQAMLLENKDAVHAALQGAATERNLRHIRIYDKKGEIHFSTDPRELKTEVKHEAESCVGCHGDPFGEATEEGITRIFRDDADRPVMTQARVIRNAEDCTGAKCHSSPDRKEYLGVMEVQMSMTPIAKATDRARRSTLYAALVMAIVGGLATAHLIWRFVRQPVLRLVEGTRRIAAGDLSARVQVTRGREFIELGDAFNQMGHELGSARKRIEKWGDELAEAVERKTEELQAAQRHIIHMEKMASLGKLAATVAHELNNPLGGILVYAKLMQRELPRSDLSQQEREELLRYAEMVRAESARCGDIVKNLLSFSRVSKNAMAEHHLHPVVERSLMTVQHLLKTSNIERHIDLFDGDDLLFCDAAELQQAFVALLVNAAEAMPSGGELHLRTTGDAENLTVLVTDTGIGIPDDVLPRIFEPFASTKGENGVGLGLAVVYGIVRRHDARIEVESEPGAGTTFRIVLPRQQEKSTPDSDPNLPDSEASPDVQ